MSNLLNTEDGYYSLTSTGTLVVIVVIVLLVLATALLKRSSGATASTSDPEAVPKTGPAATGTFSIKQLVFSGVALALAFALSYVKIIPMPWGGSVTAGSMLLVTLIGYWYGPKIGLTAAFAYSLLQFVQDGSTYILSPLQACLDYFFAFTALGVSGFFRGKKNSLRTGYLAAILLRGLFHTVGGYLYWMDYMPESFPKSLAAIYPFCYNYAFIGLEAIITLVIISIPAVVKVIARITAMAREEEINEVSVV